MQKIKPLIKKVIPKKFLPKITNLFKKISTQVKLGFLSVFSSSKLLSNWYFGILNHDFIREHKATLAGKKKYYKQLQSVTDSSYLLRRNIHRLEKGLIMPERRSIFALDFIRETVIEFQRMVENGNVQLASNAEIKWADDVLEAYFSAVDQNNPVISRCSEIYRISKSKLNQCSEQSKLKSVPFVRDLESETVSYADFYNLSKRRRSVRFYEPEIPDRKLVDMAVLAAAQSPSACNRQPFTFRLFDEPEMVKKVAGIPAGTKTFYKDLPAIGVVVGHLSAYYRSRDRHAIYVDGSLAVMSFVYALETLGMSSCVINWGDEEPAESKMSALLGLEPDDRVLMLVAYGYPKKDLLVPFSSKRNLESIRKYNEY